MLLEKNPNISLKNKKGQTAIDVASSKNIVELISHFLYNNKEDSKQINKAEKLRKISHFKELSERIQIMYPEFPQNAELKQKEKAKITYRPKKHVDVSIFLII